MSERSTAQLGSGIGTCSGQLVYWLDDERCVFVCPFEAECVCVCVVEAECVCVCV